MKLSSRPFPTFARMLLVGLLLGSALAALPQQPAQAAPLRATITVTDFADVYGGPTCTLRNAIQAANTNAAFGGCPAGNVGMDTIQLDAGTYTLSVPNLGGNNEDNNATGDLDIHDSLTIQGAGMGSTIIRGGTSGGTSGNGIDKVIAANPVCANQVSINISNLTIANGRNTQPYDTSGDWSFTGGGMDYFGCTAGDLTLTNVMFLNNVNVYGYGGGLNIDSGGSYGGTIRLDNVTFQGNITQGASGNESNGGGLNLFGENPTVIINNCTFQGNQVQNASASGGGVYIRLYSYAPGPSGNVHISNTLVQNNTSGGKGGGISVNYTNPSTVLVIDNNTRVLNNVSGAVGGGTGGGGGIVLDGSDLATTPARLSKIVVSGNSEGAAASKQGGAGIYVGQANAVIEYSRIAGNAPGGQGSGLFKTTDTGAVNAANNWWGCSTGPTAVPCDMAVLAGGSAGSLTHTPYLRVLSTAVPGTLLVNQTAAITASVLTNSAGSTMAANIERLIGLPVAWSTTAGSLSSTQTTIQAGGTATATFTATQAGTSLVAAKVDNDATTTPPASFNVASITVNKADTTTVLSGHTPDPSLAGTAVAVTYTVTSATGSVPTAPGGNVTVSDGVNSCTAAVSAGTCSLTLTTPGIRSLTAVYAGDANFNTSTSAAVSHVVQQPPLITSADNATFTYNTAGSSFTFTTTGYPLATLSSSGTLPTGVIFTPNADGTATLDGTPSQSGSFPLTITAGNTILPDATQTFTLTVQRAPEFTSAANATFTVGTAGSFDVTTNGFPAAVISTSSLPGGLTLSSTGTLAGTPVPGTGGVYTLTLTAANGVNPDAMQTFTLTVNEAPAFTSAASDTFVAGTSRTFDITTSGHPAVSALTLTSGSLPTGVTFTDDGDGTATLSGTPADDTGGSYPLTFGATNGIGTPASQNFTLTVNEAPEFTSADNTTFTVGSAGSFTISTQAFPLVTDITMIPGLLPSGVSFMNNSNGTATLSGTPAVGTGGTYSLQFLAQNGIAPNALQNFTLTVNEAPSITSAASDTFEVGTSRTFNITTDGVPAVSAVSLTSGTLPSGMTFTDGGSSATLSGTPAAGTGGSYALVFGATNGIGTPASQDFTLLVNEAPAITSVDNATFTVGTAGSFSVTSSGFPAAAISTTDTLPGGLTLSSSGTLAGTPDPGTGGTYILTLDAANSIGTPASQTFTLTVNEAPSITSAATTTFAVGASGSFDITTDGTPAVSEVSLTGDTLPSGVTFANGGSSATLSGMPAVGSGGSYALIFGATNGITPDASQSFTLLVNEAPAITSIDNATFTLNAPSSFTIISSGFPAAAISMSGALPPGVTWTDNGNGTGTLAGTPTTSASFPLSFTASNGVGSDATQNFTLTVNLPPAFTSVNITSFVAGMPGSFSVTTSGDPIPVVSMTGGTLPPGVTFTPNAGGTATLAGTPPLGTGGAYILNLKAASGALPDATQTFFLLVLQAPQFTNAASATFNAGAPNNFTFTTNGYVNVSDITLVSSTPALPAGLSFVDNHNGTALLSGTPAAGSGGTYVLELSGYNGTSPDASQTFTLTVNEAPAITSADNHSIVIGSPVNFTITTTGYPVPGISYTGSLDPNVTFTDNLNGTATLAGTPSVSGAFILNLTAANSISPDATQTFTLTVTDPPFITSAANTAFTVGTAGSFTITTTGYPLPGISYTSSPALPASITLVDNGNGTATLGGTPAAGTGGVYNLLLTASNGVSPDATQSFVLTVNEDLAFTNADNASFALGSPVNFTINTTGYPLPGISSSGALPAGVTFTDNGDGTATLSGTATASGAFTLDLTASNGISPDATQIFTLTITDFPIITSADNAAFTVGNLGDFTITTTGFPAAGITLTGGTLPAGVNLTDNGNGTATLAGTPTASGVFTLYLRAANGIGSGDTQTFTLTVNEAPAITSTANVTFYRGSYGTFTITTTGYPLPTISSIGPLPAGVTFTPNSDGTATLDGTPTASGEFTLNLKAANGIGSDATQTFTLTVTDSPIITSANNATFTVGSAGTFTITATGFPLPTISYYTGTLPAGVSFTPNSDGTATLDGTPTASGEFTLGLTAANGIGLDATQVFTLTVAEAPAITSAASTIFTVGTAGTFTITTTGYPLPVISSTSTLPGGVTLTDNGNGTATLAGTPALGTGGSYPLTIDAANGVLPNATQTFTLTVWEAPNFTSADNTDFFVGSAGSFTVTTIGYPPNYLEYSGTLPWGFTFTDHDDNTATLAGTPADGDGGEYPLTFRAVNGISPSGIQNFTLRINEAPEFTNVDHTTFPVGAAGSFMFTTDGYPARLWVHMNSSLPALPASLTYTDNGDGTGTLSGTPAAGDEGVYVLSMETANTITPNGTQTFILTIANSPAITSANNTTFTAGTAGNFIVTSTGLPLNTLTQSGTLPGGVTFTDNGDNTATLGGTPAAGTGGVYSLTFGAENGILPNATQTFTLTVNEAPAITSANNAIFPIGAAGSFTITTTGYPGVAISQAGGLPTGVTFTDNGNGTATLAGTPGSGSSGAYALTFTASNGVSPDDTQAFTLTVNEAPVITSAANTTFVVGTAGSFIVTTTGFPLPGITLDSGTLPAGVSLTDHGDGTATLAGTPALGTGGSHTFTIGAANGVLPNAQQTFTLTVNEAPTFTSADNWGFLVGSADSFTVTTNGYPLNTLTQSGSLPASLSFTDNGDNTATLEGTPVNGEGGEYPLTFTAVNGITPDGSQSFSLRVFEAPEFTNVDHTGFVVGAAGSFMFTTDGYPASFWVLMNSSVPPLPASLTYTDNGDGTGTLSGTPVVGDEGVYVLSMETTNEFIPNGTQTFTLTIGAPPAITSANNTAFTAGSLGSFTITTTGYPAAVVSLTGGTLPGGVTLTDNGDGTATLGGTPDVGTGGVYTLTFSASNGISPDATQTFTLTVNQAPAITSAANTTFGVGTAGTFTITTTGYPDAVVSLTGGTLPGGVTLTDNGDGTATLGGTPDAGTGGVYSLTLTASNGVSPDATQTFTLTINQAPAITSAANTTFVLGTAGSFTVTTTGYPAAVVSLSGGTLPGGVTLTDNGDGTATLGGTPAAGTGGVYALTFTASNGVSPDATQSFTLTVNQAPAITSANSTTFAIGAAGSIMVTTTGYPTATVALTGGTLPGGVTLTDNGDGTATLGGTPAAGTGGVYSLTFTASNGISPDATQSFTLTVNQAPAITSANSTLFAVGSAGNFTITTTGYPDAVVSLTGGTLPGGVTLTDNGDGTATLGGTPAAGTGGVYTLTFTASNGISPDATQSFTLTVNQAPAITSASNTAFTVGTAGSFMVTTTGLPTATVALSSGTLPGGVTLTDNGDGTATLGGTPAAGTGGVYTLTFTASNGISPDATQTFTLTINEAPAITSANNAAFTVGILGDFTITTTGNPDAVVSLTGGTLPGGVTLTDNGDGTATLGGTPAASTGGVYALTFTASNGVSPDATQSFTLTINEAPDITSANSTTFAIGAAGSFTVTTTGYPTATVALSSGTLPGGVTLTDNGDGTATLGGTPDAGTGGVYSLTFTASNGVSPDDTQAFTLTVNQAPAITSAASDTFMVGMASNFTITTTGYPDAVVSLTGGTLPGGVTLTDHGDGTATLGGTPNAGTGGVYSLTFTASNGVSPDATQTFTLTINQAPAITSANNATFTVGTLGDFTVTTTGYPTATVALTGGTLPGGVTLTDNGDGTATLGGTPDAGTGGVYSLTFTASNGISPDATQSFTLTVNQAPAITSANSILFTVGTAGSFTVTTTGYPDAVVSLTGGTLPGGVALTDNGDGTATLGGTPAAGTGGVYTLTFTASNGVSPDATQSFTLTVNQAPAITSANSTTFAIGAAGSFTVTTTGYPTATVALSSGTLPGGVTLTDNGDGTATLGGTPDVGTGGVYSLTFTAGNGVSPDATQIFTLTVNQAPAITSAANTTFVVGTAGSFTVTTTGYPAAVVSLTGGTLPGGVTLTDNGDGTATLGGTPAASTGGVYALTFTASNGVSPDATQSFTLTINEAPDITSANSTTFAVGTLGDFTITTTGYPAAVVSLTGGTLPGGVTLTDNGDGTASLGGTPDAGTGGVYSLTFAASNGVSPDATQSFILTVNQAPAITSANNTLFTVGSAGNFTITTTGYPTATVALTGGTLPGGVTLTDNGDGTATLGGTPDAGTGGVYSLTFNASNGVLPDATQTFTLTVNQAPAITSANSATFAIGAAGSFTVTTTGYPIAAISYTSIPALPASITLVDNGDGTATLAGTPAASDGGTYVLSLSAVNGVLPDAAQTFTLTVNQSPVFTSADQTTFTVGTAGTFNVTTTGYPDAAVTLSAGSLPAGITLIDQGDGSAILGGTAAAGTGGTYTLTLNASNGALPDATQTFTLTVNEAPVITSVNNATFTVGTLGDFTITTAGFPAAGVTLTGGTLPGGVTLTDNGDGTATLGGTPTAGTGGVYSLTFTASNGVSPNATQSFTLTINEAPAITSANNTAFTVGTLGSFTVTTTSYPTAGVTLTGGTLPGGVTLTDNGDGTASLGGTPAAGTGGVYTLTFTASNGVSPDATQSFTFTINQAPAITSASNTAFTVGTAGSFMVTTTGYPINTIGQTGTLPDGLTFVDNGDNTAQLAGTPTAGSGGSYLLNLSAANGVTPDAAQVFTLTVYEAPRFTSAASVGFTTGAFGTFAIVTEGYPDAGISYTSSPALPASLSLIDNGDGTATLSGTPLAGDGGVYVISLSAGNGVDPDASQTLTLTIGQGPAITSAASTLFTAGTADSFTVTSTGFPANTLSRTGALPAGVSFVDNGDNTALFSGTPAAGTGGVYPLTITAANGVLPDATQNFTLTVNASPVFTSANATTFIVGNAGTFSITTDAYPAAVIAFTGTLPGGVTLVDNGNGTATLSGTPAAGTSGVYTLNLAAANGVLPDATQSFTLTVSSAPVITSADAVTFITGTAGSFTVTSLGSPMPTLSSSGALPAGVSFVPNADGTATLSGTASTSGTYPLVFTAANGVLPDATQNFTLTVEGPGGVVLINSVADTGDGVLAEGEHTPAAITQLLVTFNKDMNTVSAQNPANYALITGTTPISIDSITYTAATRIAALSINGGAALLDNAYTLTVKGALTDLAGYPLGADFVRNFVIDTRAPQVIAFITSDSRLIADNAVLNATFTRVQVQFNEDISDPVGGIGIDDVTNPQNYLLFQAGKDGVFNTTTCAAGITPDDVQISTGPVVYPYAGGAAYTALVTLNNGAALPNGVYRLMVCGTTSIVDMAGNKLNGGRDEVLNFSIQRIEEADVIPATGFAPGRVTPLPEQPASVVYKDMGSLWLEIPSLGVSSTITGAPFQNDNWDVTWLYDQVGWLQGTAYPTWAGNTVLTAHIYTADGAPGPFVALKEMKYNEVILLHYAGMKYTYALRSNFLVNPNNMSWITRHEKLDWLTLITCQQFNEKTQAYDYRRVVRAVLVKVEPEQ